MFAWGNSGNAILTAAKNVFTGKIEINPSFTNSLDSTLWVAPAYRGNPVLDSQGIYTQHRVGGNLGGHVHDAVAAEVRVTSGTNATAINGLETTAEFSGVGTLISDARSITSNYVFDVGLTGSITNASLIRAQTLAALPVGFTIGTVYGLYIEPQTVGAANYSIYAPTGTSLFGAVIITTGVNILNGTMYWQNAGNTGTFFSIGAIGIPRWHDPGIQQVTVGAAGAAAAPPATPTKWLRVSDSTGAALVIPAYTA